MSIPSSVQIFRLIHIDNIEVCLKRGGMNAPHHIPKDGLVYKTIHNIDIQNQRNARPIPCGNLGTIHDYVSFYFGPRSPMLLQLHTGRVPGYDEGQEHLVYVVSTVDTITSLGLGFVFSDGHGIAAYSEWYDDIADLDKVDWEAVYATGIVIHLVTSIVLGIIYVLIARLVCMEFRTIWAIIVYVMILWLAMLFTALPLAGQGFLGNKISRYAWLEQLILHIVFGVSFWWALELS